MRRMISGIFWITMIYVVFFLIPQKHMFYGNIDKEQNYKQINFITVEYAKDL